MPKFGNTYKPPNHHYVPRCYFRPWENDQRKVVVYEKDNDRILGPYRQSSEVICAKAGLYSYTASIDKSERNLIEEGFFKTVDTRAAPILRKMRIETNEACLSAEERKDFATFLVSLRTRTPEVFETTIKDSEKQLFNLVQNTKEEDVEDLRPLLGQETFFSYTQKHHLDVLENAGHDAVVKAMTSPQLIKPMLDLEWSILHIAQDADYNLLTSDRPLIIVPGPGGATYAALSISPTHLFIASKQKLDVFKFSATRKKKIVHQVNATIVGQAHSKAFAIDTSHSIRFFERRLGKMHFILPFGEQQAP